MQFTRYIFSRLQKFFLHFIGLLAILVSPVSVSVESLTFASGAPLDDYQAKIIIPILTEAFKINHIEFRAVHMPSLRALQISNSGLLDGELHRVSNFHEISHNQYSNLLRIDCKLLSVYLTVYAKENFVINNSDDLQHYKLAYYRGRKNVDKLFNQQEIKTNIYKVNTDLQAFQMLAAGRVDVVISEGNLGNHIIQSNEKFNNIKQIKRLEKTDIYSYIHKKHIKLLPVLSKTLNQMKVQGRFK